MSCQKEELAEPPLTEAGKEATITFTLQPDETEIVEMNSKALNPEREKYLRNAEIFCYDNRTERCVWVYLSGTNTHKFNLTEGSWDIYVIGNHETRLGTIPRSQLENTTKTIITEADLEKYDCLPMKGKVTVNVTGNMRVPIVLTRIVAKIEVSTTVATAVSSKIRLKSIRLVDAPSSCTYFKTNCPISGMISYPERSCTNGSTTSFYMLENCQGTNNAISDQKYKGRENAPTNSSYLHIKAETNDELLDYYIYLGANNTTDFNVSGNKNYVITINIQGVNQADWRVDVTYIPKNVEVSITQADRSVIAYWPNLFYVGSDETLEITVKLSQPSKYNLTIPITGAILLEGVYSISPDENFFPNPSITIPAGTTTVYKSFYAELRNGWDSALFYSDCLITKFIKDPSDINNYIYVSGYFPTTLVSQKFSGDYPQ